MKKASKFEKVTGSLVSEAGGTIFAALSGAPMLSLLPVLTNSLASGRHKKRLEEHLADLNKRIERLELDVDEISDAQFKLINEIVLTILQSVDDEKIERLKIAAENAAKFPDLPLSDAVIISRTLRDISASEIQFLSKHSGKSVISFLDPTYAPGGSAVHCVDKSAEEGIVAIGLVNLGLLTRSPKEGSLADSGQYVFSALADKVMEIVK